MDGKTNPRTPHAHLAGDWQSGLRTSQFVACYARCQPWSWILTLSMIEVRAGRKSQPSVRLAGVVPQFHAEENRATTKKARPASHRKRDACASQDAAGRTFGRRRLDCFSGWWVPYPT